MRTESLLRARLNLNFDDLPFNRQLFVGRYQNTRAMERLGPHRHARTMEICYLARGRQIYEVDDQHYELRGNDVYVTFPDEEHDTGGYPQEKGILYWMQIRLPEPDEPFLVYDSIAVRPMLESLLYLPHRQFRGNLQIQQYFDRLISAYQHEQHQLKALAIANAAVSILLEVLRCAHAVQPGGIPDDIRNTQTFIDTHLDQPLPVEMLAAHAGLSISHFKAKFKRITGIPPAEYLLRRRIDRARDLLTRGQFSITEIGITLGFSTSQYFATVFKRFTGVSPSDYIKAGDHGQVPNK